VIGLLFCVGCLVSVFGVFDSLFVFVYGLLVWVVLVVVMVGI